MVPIIHTIELNNITAQTAWAKRALNLSNNSLEKLQQAGIIKPGKAKLQTETLSKLYNIPIKDRFDSKMIGTVDKYLEKQGLNSLPAQYIPTMSESYKMGGVKHAALNGLIFNKKDRGSIVIKPDALKKLGVDYNHAAHHEINEKLGFKKPNKAFHYIFWHSNPRVITEEMRLLANSGDTQNVDILRGRLESDILKHLMPKRGSKAYTKSDYNSAAKKVYKFFGTLTEKDYNHTKGHLTNSAMDKFYQYVSNLRKQRLATQKFKGSAK